MTTIAIVGAGILGAALADRLARAGAMVTLVDSRPAGEATSSSSLAWLNANKKVPQSYHEFSVRAMLAWRSLVDEMGLPEWYHQSGGLTWAESEQDRAALIERVSRLHQWGYPAEIITVTQARTLESSLTIPDGALVALFPMEGYVHGEQAVAALLARAQDAGARLIRTETDVAVRAHKGIITGIERGKAADIKADVYVCCAGWRSAHLLKSLGLEVPLVPGDAVGSAAPCFVVRTTGPTKLSRVVHSPTIAMRPAADGGLHLESSEINAAVDVYASQRDLDRHGGELLRRAQQLLPGYAGSVADRRICIRPLPVDGHPIIGWIPSISNAYLTVTHSGVTLAPLVAELAAGEILGGTAAEELARYRPDRFPNMIRS